MKQDQEPGSSIVVFEKHIIQEHPKPIAQVLMRWLNLQGILDSTMWLPKSC